MTENMDLDALRDQVVSGTPLAKETVLALVSRTEAAEGAAADLFDEGVRQKKRAIADESALARVSTLFEGVTIEHGYRVTEDVNATIRATIAMDGEA